MPYIKQERRDVFQDYEPVMPDTVGELNFVITDTVLQWLGKKPNYEKINAAIGVLECAKLELYRRVAAPFENQKCEENGDVY